MSLQSGKINKIMKLAKLVTIYKDKKTDLAKVSNYQPISLIPSTFKNWIFFTLPVIQIFYKTWTFST